MDSNDKLMLVGVVASVFIAGIVYITDLIVMSENIEACVSQSEMEYIDGDCRRIQPAE